jgi:ribonuclease BN (tRNA processing enzyme)
VRLTVIGGSGGYPGGGRPCSGYLVTAEGFSLLVDPGYGVATALSIEGSPAFDAVVVTHGHPDHCADLNPLLRARVLGSTPRAALPVYAPRDALDAVLALDRPSALAGSCEVHDLDPGAEVSIGPFRIRTGLLPHPRLNLGLRVQAGGLVLAYTGDCGPSDALIDLANGAQLLLAEASYADAVPDPYVGSLSSATDVGREATRAQVDRLVLTHLRPETDEAAALAAAALGFEGNVRVARPGLALDL